MLPKSVMSAEVGSEDSGGCGGKGERKTTSIEEALDIAGFGSYSMRLLVLGAGMLLAMGMDLFGASLTVTAAACDLKLDMSQRAMLSAVPFIGVVGGAHAWGYVSDTRGRRLTLLLSLGVGGLLAALSSLAPEWRSMAAIKLFASCFTSATNSAAYTLVGESLPARMRSRSLMYMACVLVTAQAVSAMLAYPILQLEFSVPVAWLGITLRPWRLLAASLAAPCCVCVAVLATCVHESPKFLADQGKHDEALDVLRQIYAVNNGCAADTYPVLRVETSGERTREGLMRSLWTQTVPLFRPPLLRHTALLFYLVAVIYMTASGFVMWLPFVTNKLGLVLAARGGGGAGLDMCAVIHYPINNTYTEGNDTSAAACSDRIEDVTIVSLIAYGVLACGVNVLLCAATRGRKRLAVLLVLGSCGASLMLINLVPHALAGVFLLFIVLMVALAMGALSVYFVDLYPTALRGMVSCLSVMVGRLSGFVGVNILGSLLVGHCQATMYGWGLLVCSAIVVTLYLPRDQPAKK